MSNTKTIALNTGWFGIENVIGAAVALVSSIAINRYLGPEKNGYIVYVSYIASYIGSLGGFGIPATTRKYMAEYIGMGDRGTARYIFLRTLVLQAGLATLATGGFLYWVLGDANPGYKLAAALLVLSIWPSMVNTIPAQANMATEDLSTNVPASVISAVVYFLVIGATVVLHWGVVGVGASLLAMRGVDLLVRFFPTLKRVLAWETTHAHPAELRNRMIAFAWPSIATMAVAMIVWGRSEIVLLKNLCPDIRQVSFYSLAFTMAEQMLLAATVFGTAAGATIFVQYGRDKSRLPAIAASTFRYLALISIPLHFIAASLAVPALMLFYGRKFEDAAVVVTLAPLLCIFKAFISPAQSLLQCSERQGYVIAATVVAGIVDIGVAWYFIPVHGAVGACIGNGTAQATAVVLMWAAAIYLYKVKLPWLQVAKIAFISALASLTAHLVAESLLPLPAYLIGEGLPPSAAHFIAESLPPLLAILCGGTAALIVLFGLLYLLRVFEPEDRKRFTLLAAMLPKSLAGPADNLLSMLIPPELVPEVKASPFGAAAVRPLPSAAAEARQRVLPRSQPAAFAETSSGDWGREIGVVIPAYNAAAYLPRCLESVFAQTRRPDQVIVVDDGSTDNTAALAAELGAMVVSRRNGGPAAARNSGIQNCSCRWVALLDADDLWAPEKLERQLALAGPETVLVYSGVRSFDKNGMCGGALAIDPATARKYIRYRNPIATSTVLLRRDAVVKAGGFREDIRACEDWELWLRLLPLGQFEAVPDMLASYYFHSDSLSADPERMLLGLGRFMESTLLTGLQGFDRFAWRRRIRATQLCSAGLIARDNRLHGEMRYFLRSILTWPSPYWEPRRLALLALTAKKRLRPRAETP